jgi:hypothetical protein
MYKWYTPSSVQTIHSDFNDGTVDGWSILNGLGSNASLANINNQLCVENTAISTNEIYPFIYKSGTFTAGHTYSIKFKYKVNSGTAVINLFNGGGFFNVGEVLEGEGIFEYDILQTVSYGSTRIYIDGRNFYNVCIDEIYILDITDYVEPVAKEVKASDLKAKFNNYSFADIKSPVEIASILTYNGEQTEEIQHTIAICFAKTFVLPDGHEYLYDIATGAKQ